LPAPTSAGTAPGGSPRHRGGRRERYAIANKIGHPVNVYLREDAILDPLDTWLASAFAPHNIHTTITAMTRAQPDDHTERTRQKVKDCDTTLAGYRAALDAGADPVTGWIAETQADRARAEAELHTTIEDKPHRMSRTEIAHLVASLDDALTVLRHADPNDKAEVYRQLGLRLNYSPENETVRAEINLNTHRGVLVCDRGSTQTNHPRAAATLTAILQLNPPA
jgi:site-specific DNA recombinase